MPFLREANRCVPNFQMGLQHLYVWNRKFYKTLKCKTQLIFLEHVVSLQLKFCSLNSTNNNKRQEIARKWPGEIWESWERAFTSHRLGHSQGQSSHNSEWPSQQPTDNWPHSKIPRLSRSRIWLFFFFFTVV